jgi:hypothetical protein
MESASEGNVQSLKVERAVMRGGWLYYAVPIDVMGSPSGTPCLAFVSI